MTNSKTNIEIVKFSSSSNYQQARRSATERHPKAFRIACSASEHATLWNGTTQPTNAVSPGDRPLFPTGSPTALQWQYYQNAVENHKYLEKLFNECDNRNDEFVAELLAMCPLECVEDIKRSNQNTTINLSPTVLLKFLDDKFGSITADALRKSKSNLPKKITDTSTENIRKDINSINQCIELFQSANQPICQFDQVELLSNILPDDFDTAKILFNQANVLSARTFKDFSAAMITASETIRPKSVVPAYSVNQLEADAFANAVKKAVETAMRQHTSKPTIKTKVEDYCWSHGLCGHSSIACTNRHPNHQEGATMSNKMNGKLTVWKGRNNDKLGP